MRESEKLPQERLDDVAVLMGATEHQIQEIHTNASIEQFSVPLEILSSLAKSFLTMHIIDLTRETIVEINSTPEISHLQNPKLSLKEQIYDISNKIISDSDVKRWLHFMDVDTLPKRIREKRNLSLDFVGLYHGWIRAIFIPMRFEENGTASSVIFCTRVIEEEKHREEELIHKANTDDLTGLFNRHGYESSMKMFAKSHIDSDTTFVSLDVNGLKNINDRFGHSEGDRLLIGAADCIKSTFGKFGNIYRVGGDEFVAIIKADQKELEKLCDKIERACRKWSEKNGMELSISQGFISVRDNPDLAPSELIKRADQRMFRNKAEYYSSQAYDRRGQYSAFTVITKTYTKILKVSLKNDISEVLYMDPADKLELKNSMGDTFSLWLENFENQGYVFEEDLETFKTNSNIENLLKHFEKDPSVVKFFYRRRYGKSFKKAMFEAIPAPDYNIGDEKNVYICIKVVE